MSRQLLLFAGASLLISLVLYWNALWGDALLAPLDIGPTLFEHYQFMDPDAGEVPDNHHIVDQFTYDLPLQYAVFRAYRSGEVPWWDPYTYGGRPLLADAHINGTDPIRLICYAAMPFELAYNWNYTLRAIVTGVGMFLLLRYIGVPAVIAGLLGLTYQYAGWFTLYFGHPWVQASFLYYPYLWLVWLKGLERKVGVHDAAGGLLGALVIWSGNFQSHVYLGVFAACFLCAVFFQWRHGFKRALTLVSTCAIVSFLLGFPVLANQVEFAMLSVREPIPDAAGVMRLLAIPQSLFALFPWPLGSFKTFDIGKIADSSGGAFRLFSGGASLLMCAVAWMEWRRVATPQRLILLQGLLMIGAYLIVVSSPLSNIVNARIAPLAGMAIVATAGIGWQMAVRRSIIRSSWVRNTWIVVFALGVLGSTVAILVLFPEIERIAVGKASSQIDPGSLFQTSLRRIQISRFPSEATLLNPEAWIGSSAVIIFFFGLAGEAENSRQRVIAVALLTGMVATLSFHQRFRPKHPVQMWNKMKEGGNLQQWVANELPPHGRIDETAVEPARQVFPLALGALYQIHCVQGYSALQPKSFYSLRESETPLHKSWVADLVHRRDGQFFVPEPGVLSRFHNVTETAGQAKITRESHNKLGVLFEPVKSQEGSIVRSDTHYPGWRIRGSEHLTSEVYNHSCSIWNGVDLTRGPIVFEYVPSTQWLWAWTLSGGAIIICALFVCSLLQTTRVRTLSFQN